MSNSADQAPELSASPDGAVTGLTASMASARLGAAREKLRMDHDAFAACLSDALGYPVEAYCLERRERGLVVPPADVCMAADHAAQDIPAPTFPGAAPASPCPDDAAREAATRSFFRAGPSKEGSSGCLSLVARSCPAASARRHSPPSPRRTPARPSRGCAARPLRT